MNTMSCFHFQDIAQFIEGAEHGVILLTMGMTYDPSDIPPWNERELIKAFSRLKVHFHHNIFATNLLTNFLSKLP
jgi:hypothetical protein